MEKNNMDEKKIRKIAREEARKVMVKNYQAGDPKIPPHRHNGIDNLKISQTDIIPSNVRINSGQTTFATVRDYRIDINFNNFSPTSILFYGIVVDNNGVAPITFRAHCIGSALLQGSYYLAPATDSSGNPSGKIATEKQDITQTSTYFSVDNSGNVHALVDQTHIVDVEYGSPTTIYARATIKSFDSNGITVTIDTLASGYQIIGNFVII